MLDFQLVSATDRASFYLDELGDWAYSPAQLSAPLEAVRDTLTNAGLLDATRHEVLDLGILALSAEISAQTVVSKVSTGCMLKNTVLGAEFDAVIHVWEQNQAFDVELLLQVQNLEEIGGIEILEQNIIQRTLLGMDLQGRQTHYRTELGLQRIQEMYVLKTPSGMLQIMTYCSPAADVFGRDQVDLFLDTLALVP